MKAIMVMFDSLNRKFLPPYGAEGIHAPNFARLAERTTVFDNCYAGSMPCMPARRELHTGRYNFLHRSWGPLEPFDDSMSELLKQNGVHTHLATDHYHYWEDGGATYHSRYSTFEFFRGQVHDAWKAHVADPAIPASLGQSARQNWINRTYMRDEADHSQTLTFDAGIEFLDTNHAEDNWFLQIETFDPHEPFFSNDRYRQLYPHDYDGPHFDWPAYRRVTETPGQVEHVRHEYAALLSMCDHSLGRVLDYMDEHHMWDDTMLIVCTDHGFLLGEHGWWGKVFQPWYDETIHTPLFIWDPRNPGSGQRRAALVQTIDFAPTLLDFFGLDGPPDTQGRALRDTIAVDTPVREFGLFGSHGGHVSVTDGRYVYMRACADPDNTPLHEYTLMPTHMRARFLPGELRDAELIPALPFTKQAPVLKVPTTAVSNPHPFGTLLFDLHTDPDQNRPLIDDDLELHMATALVDQLRAADAPPEQYTRLGLPPTGPVTGDHLLARAQQANYQASQGAPVPVASDYLHGPLSVHAPVRELVAEPAAVAVLRRHLAKLMDGPFVAMAGETSLFQIAVLGIGIIPADTLDRLAVDLAALDTREV